MSDFDASSLPYVEGLYEQYLNDPSSVEASWREYFQSLNGGDPFTKAPQLRPSFKPRSIFHGAANGGAAVPHLPHDSQAAIADASGNVAVIEKDGSVRGELNEKIVQTLNEKVVRQDKVDQLIRAYRVRGHMVARIDPLGRPRKGNVELDKSHWGLTNDDLDHRFSSESIPGTGSMTLREILTRMKDTYCSSIGVQFMHIDDQERKLWLQDKMEETGNKRELSADEQKRIFEQLVRATYFETTIQSEFKGAKSFSLEGGESLIPLLEHAIASEAEAGVSEIVMAMAHRGRLNVLANCLKKPVEVIYSEFFDKEPSAKRGKGDVKYHLGYSSDRVIDGHNVHLSMCFNPSHLEYVNTVALGRLRAKQDRFGDLEREQGMAILIHGDAAFIGEGVVQEGLNMSSLPAYNTGGTLHIIINNQIGFTTVGKDGYSTQYATDIAKMLQVPIFHVNAEDLSAVIQVIELAGEFRRKFDSDVVIDMVCYRRHGHNEQDNPKFTQPEMYGTIGDRPNVREFYRDVVLKNNVLTESDVSQIENETLKAYRGAIDKAESGETSDHEGHTRNNYWSKYLGGREDTDHDVDTGVREPKLKRYLETLSTTPDGFTVDRILKRFLQARGKMANGDEDIDWATGEALAFASLLDDGAPVRLTGQDSQRGTFTQRHAVLHDQKTYETYTPLEHIDPHQAKFEVANSPLSENGVLGFDYGYSLDRPEGLIMWEAQFGDFVNAAQVIIDQFIASAEDKWNRLSGITLLLPHGFEGQGPEHSSARLERFLLLAAEDNIQVVYPSTPANYFHLLRRQVKRPWRKPLIVMTPKKLLRLAAARSPLADFAKGGFSRIIGDDLTTYQPQHLSHLLICSGKVFYELDEERKKQNRTDIGIIRIEQLYPLQEKHLEEILSVYPNSVPTFWVQEEPENMGAWRYINSRRGKSAILTTRNLQLISRKESASPATGSKKAHDLEHTHLMEAAMMGKPAQV